MADMLVRIDSLPSIAMETERLSSQGIVLRMGYKYAVIGWVGPRGFYEKNVGATVVPGSEYRIGLDWLLPCP